MPKVITKPFESLGPAAVTLPLALPRGMARAVVSRSGGFPCASRGAPLCHPGSHFVDPFDLLASLWSDFPCFLVRSQAGVAGCRWPPSADHRGLRASIGFLCFSGPGRGLFSRWGGAVGFGWGCVGMGRCFPDWRFGEDLATSIRGCHSLCGVCGG